MARSGKKSKPAATKPQSRVKSKADSHTDTGDSYTNPNASLSFKKTKSPEPIDGPVVALANGYRFAAGEVKVQSQIQSRALLWCQSGGGSVAVNRTTYDLHAGRYLLLPWNRRMTYHAAKKQPFHVGAIHWIPMHASHKPVVYSVAHEPDYELADVPWRNDRPLAGWRDGVVVGSFDDALVLGCLAQYILASYQQHLQQSHLQHHAVVAKQRDQHMRTLAQVLEEQLRHDLRDAPLAGYSSRLQALLAYMVSHQDQPLDLQHLGNVANCSRATLLRMFKHELRTTPGRWLTESRMNLAMMLLRTTALPIQVIAQRAGIADAHYFSHVFRKAVGVPPREYRAQRLAL